MKNLNQARQEHPWGYHIALDRHEDYAYDRLEITPGQKINLRLFVKYFGAIYVVSGAGKLSSGDISTDLDAEGQNNFLSYYPTLEEMSIATREGIILQIVSIDDYPKILRERYRVDKSQAWGPGGEELWLQHNERFCFKRIVLPAGRVTSLQYHEQKYETNFIAQGLAQVYRGKNVGTREATKIALEVIEAGPGDFFGVPTGLVHRVEALTDLVLLEASTTHVDDVIRIEDATGRGSGRINSEHRS